MIVEAKKGIHCAKPEDIPVVEQGKLPPWKGFRETVFNACFADGSTVFIPVDTDKTELWKFYTANEGVVADRTKLRRKWHPGNKTLMWTKSYTSSMN